MRGKKQLAASLEEQQLVKRKAIPLCICSGFTAQLKLKYSQFIMLLVTSLSL
jgi:hypothetical protein